MRIQHGFVIGYSWEQTLPDLFMHVASQLCLSTETCVVVEDATAGVQAAKAGDFYSIGLGPPERVGMADLVFPSLEGVHLEEIQARLD